MKCILKYRFIAAALIATLTITCANAQVPEPGVDPTPGFNNKIPDKILTPDTVDSRIGTLNFVDGVPTPETTRMVYDNLDFLRGVEVFLNFIPAASIEAFRLGNAELGASKSNQAVIFDQLLDSQSAAAHRKHRHRLLHRHAGFGDGWSRRWSRFRPDRDRAPSTTRFSVSLSIWAAPVPIRVRVASI